ncbi:hypothetical protein FOXB_17298 [Fusarium oxysporum f. sp. conglutinans Fo5176]|uniref:Uncharacterized protein n=1 Tax=Fusarium oxysporum (strain Fo5176) TaxID=660025 RepID=F9GF64_FUSOF|nr:hypothetical protein FOXB_17298 [Fusarium oxysporum f. sp. conglutinans Fo5176]
MNTLICVNGPKTQSTFFNYQGAPQGIERHSHRGKSVAGCHSIVQRRLHRAYRAWHPLLSYDLQEAYHGNASNQVGYPSVVASTRACERRRTSPDPRPKDRYQSSWTAKKLPPAHTSECGSWRQRSDSKPSGFRQSASKQSAKAPRPITWKSKPDESGPLHGPGHPGTKWPVKPGKDITSRVRENYRNTGKWAQDSTQYPKTAVSMGAIER